MGPCALALEPHGRAARRAQLHTPERHTLLPQQPGEVVHAWPGSAQHTRAVPDVAVVAQIRRPQQSSPSLNEQGSVARPQHTVLPVPEVAVDSHTSAPQHCAVDAHESVATTHIQASGGASVGMAASLAASRPASIAIDASWGRSLGVVHATRSVETNSTVIDRCIVPRAVIDAPDHRVGILYHTSRT